MMMQILDRAASLTTIIVHAMTMPGGRKWLLFLPISLLRITTTSANELEIPQEFARSSHTNNWAVLVDTTRTCSCPPTPPSCSCETILQTLGGFQARWQKWWLCAIEIWEGKGAISDLQALSLHEQ